LPHLAAAVRRCKEEFNMDVVLHYVLTAIYVTINIGLAFFTAWLIAIKRPQWVTDGKKAFLLVVGTGILLVAGVGKLGWSIQTMVGTTPAEQMNEAIFLTLSHVGTFILFLEVALTIIVKLQEGKRSR
jgi:hypothetical protein